LTFRSGHHGNYLQSHRSQAYSLFTRFGGSTSILTEGNETVTQGYRCLVVGKTSVNRSSGVSHMPALTLERLSYSTLAKLDACPSKLYLSKGTPYKGLPSWAGVGGRAFHKLAEDYDRAGCPGWRPLEWATIARTIFADEIAAEEEEAGVRPEDWRVSGRASKAWPNREDRAWWEHHLPEMGKAYAAWRAAHPELAIWVTPDGEEAIELEIKVAVPGVRTPFLAFIDRIFTDAYAAGSLVICDLKSGSMPVEDLSQLISYASLIEIRYGVRPPRGAIYGARKGILQPITKDGPLMPSLAHVSTDTWVKGVQARERIIGLGEFPAKPGRHCGWCDVRDACTWAAGREAWRYDPQHPAYRGDLALAV
jgi:hypothetical protein